MVFNSNMDTKAQITTIIISNNTQAIKKIMMIKSQFTPKVSIDKNRRLTIWQIDNISLEVLPRDITLGQVEVRGPLHNTTNSHNAPPNKEDQGAEIPKTAKFKFTAPLPQT